MRLRITGTEPETTALAALLRPVVQVREQSEFYPNQGGGALGRVYLEIAAPIAGEVSTDE